ncbi:MAG: InlB B-repeat-containing protein [Treponema sp.]
MPANGTLKAKVAEATGEKEINSGEKIEEGKTITFTATPNDGYKVKEWKLGGKPITKAGTGTEYKHTVTALATITMSFEPIPQGKVILTLDASKHDIKVKAKTKDGSAIKVEGCTVATLESDKYMDLHANGEKVTLIGDIIELYCPNNQLTALDAQSLNSLQKLDFNLNQLTAFNVQGLASLQELICNNNKLSSLDVKDC